MLERAQQLGRDRICVRPRERQSLDAVGIGVLRRREAAFRQTKLAQHVVEGLLGHFTVTHLAEHEPTVDVRRNEESVVVKHLLEVRHEPFAVDRVTMEAAADEVVQAAGAHRVERPLRHLSLVATQQEFERGGRWELRRTAKTARHGIEGCAQCAHCIREQRRRQRFPRRLHVRLPLQFVDERGSLSADVLAPLAPCTGDRVQHLTEARQSVPRFRREVRAAVERFALGRDEDSHRPAPVPGEGDHGIHVDRVHIGTFLAVDLDADEALVHELRSRRVLERLVLHHVTPMARRVADGEEDRLVLLSRAADCLVAPRVPIDGIFCVLQEIRTGLLGEPVHPHTLPVSDFPRRFAFESARLLLRIPELTDVDDFAVAMSDPDVMRLISIINPDNEPSKRVAAKIGARYKRDIVRPAGYFAELWTT